MADRVEPAVAVRSQLPALLLTHAARIRRFAAARIPARLAAVIAPEDIVQEVFTAAYLHADELAVEPGQSQAEAFAGWVITLAENELIDAIRTADAQKRGGGAAAEDSISGIDLLHLSPATPSRVVAGRELELAVRRAVAALPDGQRQVISLFHLEDHSVEQIVQALGLTFNQVRHQLYVGRRALRDLLGRAGDFFTEVGDRESSRSGNG